MEEKTKQKQIFEKNNELMKHKIILAKDQNKHCFKHTHNLALETKHYQAVENRISHEMMINNDMNDVKVWVSKLKYLFEERMEENRQIRNEILIEEKNLNLAKEDIQKTNKAQTDCIKEKDNFRLSINQLKRHKTLMKEKVRKLEEKNKVLVTEVYQLSMNNNK